jgi:hypothetical protein
MYLLILVNRWCRCWLRCPLTLKNGFAVSTKNLGNQKKNFGKGVAPAVPQQCPVNHPAGLEAVFQPFVDNILHIHRIKCA